MKGIILAGGAGSRMYPMTTAVNKQLLPIHDKPLIYYPLTTLISSGIKDICIIANPDEVKLFDNLLGSGENFGLKIIYRVQNAPNGIPEAFLIAEDFIQDDNVALILGDNIFVDSGEIQNMISGFTNGASVLGYQVNNPQNFGVIEFNSVGAIEKIVEKPKETSSRVIVPGLYVYDKDVVNVARQLRPSSRGELEITDLNMIYLRDQKLHLTNFSRGSAWIDAGSPSSFSHASSYIATIEKTHGLKIGCPEEAALNRNFINGEQLRAHSSRLPDCDYKNYLDALIGVM